MAKTQEPLAAYCAKRDFAKTTEPRGERLRSAKGARSRRQSV